MDSSGLAGSAFRLPATVLALTGVALLAIVPIGLLAPGLLGSVPRIVLFAVVPAVVGSTLLLIALCRREWSSLALAYLVAIGAALLMAEVYLSLGKAEPALPEQAREAEGDPFVCALSFPPTMEVLRLDGRHARNLAGISGSTIGADLDGTARAADERGFNNPPGLWSKSAADIVAVGDSFTFGADVPIGEGFVDRIRERFPSTVNLGCGGNGPLTELGDLVEYGEKLRPRVVLWVYYEGNDLHKDIYTELQSPVLSRYLEVGFRQGLEERQSEIDAGLRATLQRSRAMGSAEPAATASDISEWLSLTHLRTALGLRHRIKPGALDMFERILGRAKDLVAGWNGKLVLVTLPAESRYTSRIAFWDSDAYARQVIAVAKRQGIPVIDVAAEFDQEPDPRKLYRGHFTVEGYAKASEAIVSVLTRLELTPSR